MSKWIVNSLLAAVCMSSAATAQMQGGFPIGGRGAAPAGGIPSGPISRPLAGSAIDFHANRDFGGRHFRRQSLVGSSFFYPDYPYEAAPTQPPQIIVVQPMAAATVQPKEDPKPPTPLMIEWRGDRYVRSGGSESADRETRNQAALPADSRDLDGSRVRTRDSTSSEKTLSQSKRDLSPVLLLFRDGHRQEANNYVIIGDTLYNYSNPYTGQSWTLKIQLTDLDLPGTVHANQARGMQFTLPDGPNQIVAWP